MQKNWDVGLLFQRNTWADAEIMVDLASEFAKFAK